MLRRPHQSRYCPRRAVTATAAALAIAFAGAAFAQPAGPGFGGPAGHMHGGMGGAMRGPMAGGGEEMLGHLIAEAKAKLNLNTQQGVMFDAAVAQSKAARETARSLHQKVKDALAAELAKAEPDFAAVGAAADAARAQGAELHKQIRTAWLNLYATFSAEQKAIVRDMMKERIARMESFRKRMQERFSTGG
jgi:Spy/CpxP family protein refolding chaperone